MKIMCLNTGEFIRRFLVHVLPDGFHRIRHYGLLTSAGKRLGNPFENTGLDRRL